MEHTLVLEGDRGDLQLVAAPTHGFGQTEVQLGEPFRFSSKYGTRLWLFEPGVEWPERYDRDAFEGLGVWLELPAEISYAPLIHPLATVRTTLRLVGVREGEPRLEFVEEERLTDWGQPTSEVELAAALLSVAAIGGLLLFFLGRRRRRQQGG